MSSTHIAIVGNGKTTRSNVEALLGDFIYAVDDVTLIVQVRKDIEEPINEAGAWIIQFAEDKTVKLEKTTDIYSRCEELLKEPKDNEVKLYVLWDDDDLDCQVAAAFSQANNIPAFDLTDGLVSIPVDNWSVEAPQTVEMPEAEMSVKEETADEKMSQREAAIHEAIRQNIFEAMDEDLSEDWDEEDEEPEEMQGGELIEAAIEEAGKLMARAFVTEMIKLLKDDKRDQA